MKKKLLFVVAEDWYFVSHRLNLGIAAINQGYEVVVATRERDYADAIRDAGIRLIPFELSRRSGNPIKEIWKLFRLYRDESPQIIHHVALKISIYGSIASWLAGSIGAVNAISGLGWIYTSEQWMARVLRFPVRYIMGKAFSRAKNISIVQNIDDRDFLICSGVDDKFIRLIPGAGVDIDRFYPLPRTEGIPCVVLAARMLWDKGVGEYVEAARILADQGVKARFILVGDIDLGNPASIPIELVKGWHGKWGIDYRGRVANMPSVWQSADIACLPSYREGMPKSLLEAASCGLPIVTTDVPGCKEVIVDGQEGLIVPAKDAKSLAKALKRLIDEPSLRKSMGAKARTRAEAIFSQKRIIAATLQVYKNL